MRVNSLLGISLKTLKTWELSAPATEFFFLLHQQVVGLCSKVMYLLHLLCDCNQPGWLNHLYMLSQYHEKIILLSLENKLYYVEYSTRYRKMVSFYCLSEIRSTMSACVDGVLTMIATD